MLAGRKPGPTPRVAFAVPPLPRGKGIKFLACRTILRGSGWDFDFLLPLPKKLCCILAWTQNATTPCSKHYKTIFRPDLLRCFNRAAVRYEVQVAAGGLYEMLSITSDTVVCFVRSFWLLFCGRSGREGEGVWGREEEEKRE